MRTRIVAAVVSALAAGWGCGGASAQSFPTRMVKLVITYPAGGSSDVMGRLMGLNLQELWGQQVLVESKPGAAGAIGMEYAARQPADGYTFVIGNIGPAAVNPLISKVPYDVLRDFAPISLMSSGPNIVVVNPAAALHSVKDLTARAKATPGKLSYGSSGPGSMSHLGAEMFKRMTGATITHIPYKGGTQWSTDLLAGNIDVIFADPPPVLAHIKSGRLRALAVTSEKRSTLTPEIPTVAEGGVGGYHAVNWWGTLVPAGTPRPIVEKMALDMAKALGRPEIREKYAQFGVEPVWSTPDAFRAHIAAEMDKWGRLIREAGLRPE